MKNTKHNYNSNNHNNCEQFLKESEKPTRTERDVERKERKVRRLMDVVNSSVCALRSSSALVGQDQAKS